jgi:hypothetical protein
MAVQVKGLPAFQGKVVSFAQNAPKADVQMVSRIALASKTIILAGASPKRLSRFANGKGVTLKANYRVTERPAVATILPTPPGPWYLLEKGAVEHTIGRRGSRRGARRGQPGFLGNRAAGFAAVGPVEHKGAPAKHTWSRAVTPAVVGGRRIYHAQAARTYLKMF